MRTGETGGTRWLVAGAVLTPLAVYSAFHFLRLAGFRLAEGASHPAAAGLGLALGSLFLLRLPLPLGTRLALAAASIPLGYALLTVWGLVLACPPGTPCL